MQTKTGDYRTREALLNYLKLPWRIVRYPHIYVRHSRRLWKYYVSRNGAFDELDLLWMASSSCPQLWDCLLHDKQPGSILDAGCGTGKAIDFFVSRGVPRVLGLEGSQLAIEQAQHRHLIKHCNLNNNVDLGEQFDLVFSFEVAEHIHSKYADVFVDTLCRHGGLVILSAAPPGQGGHLHWNEQPKSYWIAKFEAKGFSLDRDYTNRLTSVPEPLCKNLMAFVR